MGRFPGGLDGKESACSVGDPASTPGSRRSPGEGNGFPLHYSCLENSMDRGAWQSTVHRVAKVRHNWVTNTTINFYLESWLIQGEDLARLPLKFVYIYIFLLIFSVVTKIELKYFNISTHKMSEKATFTYLEGEIKIR